MQGKWKRERPEARWMDLIAVMTGPPLKGQKIQLGQINLEKVYLCDCEELTSTWWHIIHTYICTRLWSKSNSMPRLTCYPVTKVKQHLKSRQKLLDRYFSKCHFWKSLHHFSPPHRSCAGFSFQSLSENTRDVKCFWIDSFMFRKTDEWVKESIEKK